MHPLAAGLARRQFEDLDAYIDGRNANLGRLSAGLEGVVGVDPPARRAYATRHPYFNYKPLYDAEVMDGLDRRLFIRALKAEGAPVDDSTSVPLHCEHLFQVSDDRSRTYGRDPNRRVYSPGDLPNAERYAGGRCAFPPTPIPGRS